ADGHRPAPVTGQHEWSGAVQPNGSAGRNTNGGQLSETSPMHRAMRVVQSRGTDARHLSQCAPRAAPTLADQRHSADLDTAMIAVGIVDDHPIVRHGMSHLLEQWPGVTVIASGATVSELGSIDSLDVVVLDLYLGSDDPALESIPLLAASTPVLVVSASACPADVLGAIRAGASGYLPKDCQPELLAAGV